MPTLDSVFLAKRSQDSIVAVLNHGVGRDMKSFKDKLSPDERAAVARYVKKTFEGAARQPRRPTHVRGVAGRRPLSWASQEPLSEVELQLGHQVVRLG